MLTMHIHFIVATKTTIIYVNLTKTTWLIDFVTDVTFPIVVGLKIYLNDMLCFANDPLENYFITKDCRSNFGEKAGACPKNFLTCRKTLPMIFHVNVECSPPNNCFPLNWSWAIFSSRNLSVSQTLTSDKDAYIERMILSISHSIIKNILCCLKISREE